LQQNLDLKLRVAGHKDNQGSAAVPSGRIAALVLFGDLKFVAPHFPFDAHEEIEMHSFGFQPCFQVFAGIGKEFHEHFSFQHVDENAFRVSEAPSLHALC
jgi:hypothetical protein